MRTGTFSEADFCGKKQIVESNLRRRALQMPGEKGPGERKQRGGAWTRVGIDEILRGCGIVT